jgi:hypothetical protein
MSKFFATRIEQDRAVERLLRSIGRSEMSFSLSFIYDIDGSDHEVVAAMTQNLVDVWANHNSIYFRVSNDGKSWLRAR